MPFIARNSRTGERIDITTIKRPREVINPAECVCQLCGAPMIVKAGAVLQAHFAHRAICHSDYRSHPESMEHRKGKQFIALSLAEDPECAGATIEYEVPIKEVRRVADVLVTLPSGWRIAHEVQLAGITPDELEERTNDYESAGIDVVWYLGKSAATTPNRDWSVARFGQYIGIQIITTVDGRTTPLHSERRV